MIKPVATNDDNNNNRPAPAPVKRFHKYLNKILYQCQMPEWKSEINN